MTGLSEHPAPGAISALLAEMARIPELDPGAPAPGPGDTLGRFEILRELGRGGFGVVFEARDPELGRHVALKLIRPRRGDAPAGDAAAFLYREAEAVAQMQHPNIVTLHDVGFCRAGPFLVMECLRGESLAARLGRGPLPVQQAVAVALAICRALIHAHRAGVLHRDLKPANVFLVEGGPVKVLDFGLAHALGQLHLVWGGTPGYMAPEQREGRSEDERTDVFSLGLVLHEMLGGTRGPDSVPRPLQRAGNPPALVALVARATAPHPADRPECAASFLESLLEVRRAWAAESSPARAAASAGSPVRAARLEAYRYYVLGQQCARYPAMGQDCGALLRKAVALDPDLAEAQYELAVWLGWGGGSRSEQEAAISAALRNAGDAPERERRLIEAWAAQVAGRDEEALASYRRIVETWPDEVRAWYHAGDLLRHRDEFAAAVPWFEQVVALDPEFGWAAGHLADALGALGRSQELLAWARRWVQMPGLGSLHGLSVAHGWLRDAEAAARAGERAVAVGGGVAAREDQLAAMFFSGRFAEVEGEVSPLTEPVSPVRRIGFYALAALQAYQGRRRAGYAMLDLFAREVPAVRADSNYHAIRADYLVGDEDVAGIREEIEELEVLDPRVAAEQAINLAWLGDLEGTAALQGRLPAGSMLAETVAALAAWHAGEHAAALDRLRRVCARSPVLTWRVAPLYLLGELLVRDRHDAEGVEALRRFEKLYVWRQMWRSWAWPRAQVLMGEALLRLGDRAGAVHALDTFLAAWRGAEEDAPLLAQARALHATASGPG